MKCNEGIKGHRRLHTHSVGGRPLHNAFNPSWRTILTKASCRDAKCRVSVERSAVWQSGVFCEAQLYTMCKWWHAMGMGDFYQCAIKVTAGFVPGLGVAVFTNTYVVHKSIAVDKAFPWKILKKLMWSSNIYCINIRNTRPTHFILILPLGKGFFCACNLIFTTSKGVTEKSKQLTWASYVWQLVHCTNVAKWDVPLCKI